MSRKDLLSNFDSPIQTQPPKGSAEGDLNYGGVTDIDEARDPMGVMPKDAKPRNIGPASKE